MFSRREREFLRLLADGASPAAVRQLETRFPNSAYRRRLFWGIRRKALYAARDWELYAQAARHEARVVHPQPLEGSAKVPVYTEPIAALAKRLGGLVRAPSRRIDPESRRAVP